MNCDRCPHMARIRAALAPCQSCEAGRLHGQISTDATTAGERAYQRTRMTSRSSEQVTALPERTETELRQFMTELFDLDDVELLMVKHVMHGGSFASFAGPIKSMKDRLNGRGYDLSKNSGKFRSLAKSWADKIVAKVPRLGPVFAAAVESNRGNARGRPW